MNDLYIVCSHCDDELPLTFEDRLRTPMLAAIMLDRHRAVCDAFLRAAGAWTALQAESYLRKVASRG